MKRNMEIRLKDIQLDLDSEHKKIGGYINVTERQSETLYSQKRNKWFKETIRKGTFTRALQKNESVPLLLEHDWDKQLAHTSNGTLELREDAIGLRFDAVVSEDTYNDIQARNISACSFGFRVNEEQLEEVNAKLEKRYVTNIDLFEVSLVANPAYSGSIVEERNLAQALEELKENEISEKIEDTVEKVEETVEEVKETIQDVVETVEEVVDTVKEVIEEVKEVVTDATVEESTEERAVLITGVEETKTDVTEEAKEVIEQVIESTQKDAEFYSECAKDVEEYKEQVEEDHQEYINNLQGESLYYTTLAYKKWLEVAKLKEIAMNL